MMNNKSVSAGITIAFLLGSLLFAGCTEEPPTPREQAEQLLQANDYQAASAILQEELAKAPADSELHYLAGIAALGESLDQINFVTTLVLGIVGDLDVVADVTDDGNETHAAILDENAFLQQLVAAFVDFLRDPMVRAVQHLDAVQDGTEIHLKNFQMRFWHVDFFELSGTWDTADARTLQTLVAPAAALLHILSTVNLDLDAYYVVHRVIGTPSASGAAEYMSIAANVFSSQDYPDVLKTIPARSERLVEARDLLADGFAAFDDMRTLAAAQRATDTVFTIDPDEDGSIAMKNRVRMDEDGYFDINFRVQENTSYQSLDFAITEDWIEASSELAEHFRSGSPRVSLEDHVIASLLPLVFGVLNHADLPAEVASAIDGLGSNLDTVQTLIAGVIPSDIELDAFGWLGHGEGLRPLVPAIQSDLPVAIRNFLFEWECPAFFAPDTTNPVGSTGAFPGGLACPDKGDEGFESAPDADFVLVDSDHFIGPIFTDLGIEAATADGLESSWPRISWQDPSWGGLLYLDGGSLIEENEPAKGFKPATNRSINAFLGQVESEISSFLD